VHWLGRLEGAAQIRRVEHGAVWKILDVVDVDFRAIEQVVYCLVTEEPTGENANHKLLLATRLFSMVVSSTAAFSKFASDRARFFCGLAAGGGPMVRRSLSAMISGHPMVRMV
jgi:hypothetical protein